MANNTERYIMKKLNSKVLNRRVWNQKIYDLHTREFMLWQTAKYLKPDKTAIDVGAAVGMYSHWFAKHSKCVYSFEAVPEVFKQLQNTALEAKNIYPYNLAVGKDNGHSLSFFVDDKRLSNSGFKNLVDGIEIKVDCVSVDSMDFQDVGFIKIDTEGTEFDVLLGAEETINKYLPTLMVEIYEKFSENTKDIFDWLHDKGYVYYYNTRGKGLTKINNQKEGIEIATDPEMVKVHDCDFLFVHNGNIS